MTSIADYQERLTCALNNLSAVVDNNGMVWKLEMLSRILMKS